MMGRKGESVLVGGECEKNWGQRLITGIRESEINLEAGPLLLRYSRCDGDTIFHSQVGH